MLHQSHISWCVWFTVCGLLIINKQTINFALISFRYNIPLQKMSSSLSPSFAVSLAIAAVSLASLVTVTQCDAKASHLSYAPEYVSVGGVARKRCCWGFVYLAVSYNNYLPMVTYEVDAAHIYISTEGAPGSLCVRRIHYILMLLDTNFYDYTSIQCQLELHVNYIVRMFSLIMLQLRSRNEIWI